MFTDVEGYTSLMQENETQARLIRKKFRDQTELSSEKYGGQIVQYFGDGSLLIFPSALASISCAVEMQKAWRREVIVPVRIGIHLGEVELQDGEVIGDAVNIASRIESAATAGSVLLSGSILAQIRNHPEFKVRSLGAWLFKNVLKPLDLFAIDDPLLVTPDVPRMEAKLERPFFIQNLPIYPSPFIGRVESLKQICQLFQESECRHLTVLGPGGLGKTRIAVEAGNRLLTQFRHGVCFIALDLIEDYRQVPQAIAAKLSLKENPGREWMQTIIEFLTDKEMLLILDNLEQILEASEYITEILTSCPKVHILATSREVLNSIHEVEFTLGTFKTPNELVNDPELALQNESCALFVQKARTLNPLFEVHEADLQALQDICKQLDGLPLAIELAASRTKLFSISAIHERLEDVFKILRGAKQGSSTRHQTIHNTIQWSYNLLSDHEKQVFCQMALFPAGFTIDSLEAVIEDLDPIESIESLMNKSLIRRIDGPEGRFGMLKVIRDFGISMLEYVSHRPDSERQFAEYFLSFVKANEENLIGKEQIQWLHRFDREFENLRKALELLKLSDIGKARELVSSLWRYYLSRGFITSGLKEIEDLLDAQPIGDELQAKLSMAAGTLKDNIGDPHGAQLCFQDSLAIYKSLKLRDKIARTLNHLGWTEYRLGNYQRTISYATDALQIYDEVQDNAGKIRALNNIAWTSMYRGEFEKARDQQREILAIARSLESPRSLAFCQICLAWALAHCGEYNEASVMIEEAIDSLRELQDQQMIAFALTIKAHLLMQEDGHSVAEQIIVDESLPLFEGISDRWAVGFCHSLLYEIYLKRGDAQLARKHLGLATEIRSTIGDRWGVCRCLLDKAYLKYQVKEGDQIREILDQALQMAYEMEASNLLFRGLYLKGVLKSEDNDFMEAVTLFLASRECLRKMGNHQQALWRASINEHLDQLAAQLNEDEYQRISKQPILFEKIICYEH